MHAVSLLRELTGAEDAIVVNNCASALVLALNSLAAGREAVVSRGELIEIGGSFRVPDIMAKSGATLVEVGTTNRTHLADYEEAIGESTGAIVKVHRSNFELHGFVSEVGLAELAELARTRAIPLLFDFGSGLLVSLDEYGLRGESTARDAVRTGATLVDRRHTLAPVSRSHITVGGTHLDLYEFLRFRKCRRRNLRTHLRRGAESRGCAGRRRAGRQ